MLQRKQRNNFAEELSKIICRVSHRSVICHLFYDEAVSMVSIVVRTLQCICICNCACLNLEDCCVIGIDGGYAVRCIFKKLALCHTAHDRYHLGRVDQ